MMGRAAVFIRWVCAATKSIDRFIVIKDPAEASTLLGEASCPP